MQRCWTFRFSLDDSWFWTDVTLIGVLPVNCSSNRKREEYENDESDKLSGYGFLSSTLMPLPDSVCLTPISTARKKKLNMFQKSMRRSLHLLTKCKLQRFSVEDHSAKQWRCFSASGSSCCDISKTKDMSTVLHWVAVSHLSFFCMSSVDDIYHFWCCESQDVEQTKAA